MTEPVLGIPVVVSSFVPRDQIFVVDPRAIEVDWKPEPYELSADDLATRWRFEMRWQASLTREPDPFWRKPPRGTHARWRWFLSVISYDWRKARGELRLQPPASSLGIIQGITS